MQATIYYAAIAYDRGSSIESIFSLESSVDLKIKIINFIVDNCKKYFPEMEDFYPSNSVGFIKDDDDEYYSEIIQKLLDISKEDSRREVSVTLETLNLEIDDTGVIDLETDYL